VDEKRPRFFYGRTVRGIAPTGVPRHGSSVSGGLFLAAEESGVDAVDLLGRGAEVLQHVLGHREGDFAFAGKHMIDAGGAELVEFA
jgi:hypothetical protein